MKRYLLMGILFLSGAANAMDVESAPSGSCYGAFTEDRWLPISGTPSRYPARPEMQPKWSLDFNVDNGKTGSFNFGDKALEIGDYAVRGEPSREEYISQIIANSINYPVKK